MASAEIAVGTKWEPTPSSRYGKDEIVMVLVGAGGTVHRAFLRDLGEALMLQVQSSRLQCHVYLRTAEEYRI
jgi:hypothetical protein